MIATTQDSPSSATEPEFNEVARIDVHLGEDGEDVSLSAEENRWQEQYSEVTRRHWPAVTNVVVQVGSDMLELLPQQALDEAPSFIDFGVDLAAFAQRAETGWNPAGPAPALDIASAGISAVRQITRRVCEDAAKGDGSPLPAVRVGDVGNQLLNTVVEATAEVSAACSKERNGKVSPTSDVFFAVVLHAMGESFKRLVAEARAAGKDEATAVKHQRMAFMSLVELSAEYALDPDD